MTIQENVALAPLTTLQVGGAARYFAELREKTRSRGRAVREKPRPAAVCAGRRQQSGRRRFRLAGAGPEIAIGGISSATNDAAGNAVLFSVGAGVDWDDFVAQAVVQNCAGVECLSGIPGSVGGTPVQNVGAYGQEVSDTIESVRALDLKEDRIVVLPKPACGFRYRSSIFNSTERGRYIILRVNYRLKRGGAASLKYADLQKHFAERFPDRCRKKTPPSLAEVREAVRAIRRSKGMLIVPGDDDCRSAGSFFKNPVLSEAQFKDLAARAAAKGLEIPSYPALDAQRKVSAAWLVEHSGFSKGYAVGAGRNLAQTRAGADQPRRREGERHCRLKDAIQRGVQEAWGFCWSRSRCL
jgi:UDP-N-acetylmuramate dehydrogenase